MYTSPLKQIKQLIFDLGVIDFNKLAVRTITANYCTLLNCTCVSVKSHDICKLKLLNYCDFDLVINDFQLG